ncbi:hypothetical protein ACFXO9_21820 [Nocardia tengchongensis]|uniref:hypothetical protein n=1 Tax=Nocardia tengchongensis TaxID=2055889 RepID=UPI0036CD3C38
MWKSRRAAASDADTEPGTERRNLMPSTSSRVSHHRLPMSTSMQSSNGVKILLWPHRLCIEGPGCQVNSCSARQQLLEIARLAGWSWVVDVPTTEIEMDD